MHVGFVKNLSVIISSAKCSLPELYLQTPKKAIAVSWKYNCSSLESRFPKLTSTVSPNYNCSFPKILLHFTENAVHQKCKCIFPKMPIQLSTLTFQLGNMQFAKNAVAVFKATLLHHRPRITIDRAGRREMSNVSLQKRNRQEEATHKQRLYSLLFS